MQRVGRRAGFDSRTVLDYCEVRRDINQVQLRVAAICREDRGRPYNGGAGRNRRSNLEIAGYPPPTTGLRLYSHLVSATEPTDFPMPEVDPKGVDLAQVRRMLALTPGERLRVLESALASMIKVRDAGRIQVDRLLGSSSSRRSKRWVTATTTRS